MTTLWSTTQIARQLGVNSNTLGHWSNTLDVPEPCAVWDRDGTPVKFWRPSRLPEWRVWLAAHLAARDERYVRRRG